MTRGEGAVINGEGDSDQRGRGSDQKGKGTVIRREGDSDQRGSYSDPREGGSD